MNYESTILPITTYVIRLWPGEDLKASLEQFAAANTITAGWIVTAMGSLSVFRIRFADNPAPTTRSGSHEILSVTGTLSVSGSHLHIAVADSAGITSGGHLAEGCIIYTTAEIVIQCTAGLHFKRSNDGKTPWKELVIEKQQV